MALPTMTVTWSLTVNCVSVALNFKTYTPSALKVTVLLSALGEAKVAVPGPLACDHVVVSAAGAPSSVAVALTMMPCPLGTSAPLALGLVMLTLGGKSLS